MNKTNFAGKKVMKFNRSLISPSYRGHQFRVQINRNNAIHDIVEVDKEGNSIGRYYDLLNFVVGRQFCQDTINTIYNYVNSIEG